MGGGGGWLHHAMPPCATLKPTAIRIHDCGDGAGIIEYVNAESIHDKNTPVTARCLKGVEDPIVGACVGDVVYRLKLWEALPQEGGPQVALGATHAVLGKAEKWELVGGS